MPKPLFDLAAFAGVPMNRAPAGMGPGLVRVGATDEAGDSAEVYIYGDIGIWWDSVQAEDFAKEIGALDVGTINVRLNSPGGSVFDGIAIYNALAHHQAEIIVHIDGIAASIASVIAMAGDTIRAAEGTRIMVHKPWSFSIGNSDAMRKEAEILDKLEADIVDLYEARTGQDRAKLTDWVAAETWFSAKEAVDAGFADEIVPAKKKEKKAHARSAMLPLFKNTPADLVATDRVDGPPIREFERLLRDGEGLSHAQARRIVAAARALAPRDAAPEQPTPRDEGDQAAELRKLADHIRSLKP